MEPWSHRCESVLSGKATKYTLRRGDEPLGFDAALDLLASGDSFTQYLTALLRASPQAAYRWETPPITVSRIGRPFEFVLTNDPFLETSPEPEVFGACFDRAAPGTQVLAIPNLGRTATMVVPRQIAELDACTHLANCVRRAPADQVAALWACVAATARKKLSLAPLWISTAGGGVSWLHVRIEGVPKYCAYRPYANDV